MRVKQINTALYNLLGDELIDWERDELALKLSLLSPDVLKEVMRHLPVIWPVSYMLFYAFIEQASTAGSCLKPEQFHNWVKAVLDVYEADGLRQAQLFMEEVESKYVCQIRGEAGASLLANEHLLASLARGMLGRDIKIIASPETSFDTENLLMPPVFNICSRQRHNFFLYKLTTTFMAALELGGTFAQNCFCTAKHNDTDNVDDLHAFLATFADHRLAADLLYLCETIRILANLKRYYAGLCRDCHPVFSRIRKTVKAADSVRSNIITAIQGFTISLVLNDIKYPTSLPENITTKLTNHYNEARTLNESMTLSREIYDHASQLPGPYTSPPPLPFMGRLNFTAAYEQIAQRQDALRDNFIKTLSAVIPPSIAKQDKTEIAGEGGSRPTVESLTAMLTAAAADTDQKSKAENGAGPEFITIDLELTKDLIELTRNVEREFGQLPRQFISSAIGMAGSGISHDGLIESDKKNEDIQATGPLCYDEWDFRRSGFRKKWCKIISKDIDPAGGTFVNNTLNKYRGLLINLRRQFELMSIQERLMKRQREGDEIDLDALQESIFDTKAGLPPSERLFVRRQRNDRDIAALFLVDMSSSTEGWISTAIKESLILMSESLSALGDRYAIYGFSGMRRLRNEFFRVKDFETPYDDDIKNRIAAIAPREYTRMGPAIRHATSILADVDARVRLLITLSDGKPEDYDDYKGRYAIEDTRHALIEAKTSGIHPFCITVDREAHEYIEHMYGEVNYIFINNVNKLPIRMPEIYRSLTS